MRLLTRHVRGVDVAAAAYAAAFFAWLAVRTPGTPSADLVGAAAFYPLGLVVAWLNWSNSRLPGLDTRTRLAWRLLALSALLLFVSGSAWDIYLRLVASAATPAFADYLEPLHSVLLVSACVVFPGRRVEGRSRTRFLLDAGVMVIGGIAVVLYFGLKLWFTVLQSESLLVVMPGFAVDCVVFGVAAVSAMQKRDRGTRIALVFSVLALMMYVAGNYAFTAVAYGPGGSTYRPGDSIDGLWFGAWIFRWLAARISRYRYQRDAVLPDRTGDAGLPEYESSGFSYLVVGSAFLLLLGRVYAHDQQFLGVLAVSTSLMLGLLVTRQVVELRENDRLFRRELDQQARFRSLVQHSSDILLVVDSNGAISYASPAVARVFGADSPVRSGSRVLDVVREDDRAVLGSVIANGRGPRRLLLHLPAGRDDWREIEMLWNDRRGDPAVGGIIFNGRDVTVRRELERQLRHAQKLDAVGRLADGLAHDVNNSLAIIRGVADLLDAEVPLASPAAEDLAHIRQAVDRAAGVTRKVLAFGRKTPVQRTVIDINGLVRDLLPVLRQSVTSKVDVRLALSPDLWAVRADQGQIEQVLVNLATNARDAMPGGGTLEIATVNRVVGISSPEAGDLQPGEYVSIVVADEGAGMNAEVLSRIFEPFFSTKAHGTGMGLGLAMVHGIVHDAGGRVLVQSVVGRGSSFTILLPRTLAPAAVAEPETEGANRPGHLHTVLVVDDEPSLRTVARRILERHGYRVIEAASGDEALPVIADPSVQFDVLLTDLVMPGINGRELIARCEGYRPSVPVVCMTGFAGESDDQHWDRKNLVEILSKPFTAEGLERAIAAAVARRGAL